MRVKFLMFGNLSCQGKAFSQVDKGWAILQARVCDNTVGELITDWANDYEIWLFGDNPWLCSGLEVEKALTEQLDCEFLEKEILRLNKHEGLPVYGWVAIHS